MYTEMDTEKVIRMGLEQYIPNQPAISPQSTTDPLITLASFAWSNIDRTTMTVYLITVI